MPWFHVAMNDTVTESSRDEINLGTTCSSPPEADDMELAYSRTSYSPSSRASDYVVEELQATRTEWVK